MGLLYDAAANIYVDPEDNEVLDGDTMEHLGYLPDEQEFSDPLEDRLAALEADMEGEELSYERGRKHGVVDMNDAMDEAQFDLEMAEQEAADDFDEAMQRTAAWLDRPISESQVERIHDILPDEYDENDVMRAVDQAGLGRFDDQGARGREQRQDYMTSRLNEMEADEVGPYGSVEEVEQGGGASAWAAGFDAGSGNTQAGATDSGLGAGRKPGQSIT
jgi:hypothetical protein